MVKKTKDKKAKTAPVKDKLVTAPVKHLARAKHLARVTHLECTALPTTSAPQPSRPRLALLEASEMPVQFYRYLFEQVGKKQHWYSRRVMSDDKLTEIIHAPSTHIHVLYADGSPAGYFELDASKLPSQVEIVFFGLTPDFQGMGLGKWFLGAAIANAWALNPEKLILQTNTLDHPAALQLYQKHGFSPVRISEEEIELWE